MKVTLVSLLLVTALAAAGCPERKEVIDQVGGAPKAQVDEARRRIDKAEDKLETRAAEAAAATE